MSIYHEKQSLQFCAQHALNNVLQEAAFTKGDLDAICAELAPESSSLFNPHKSWLGLGNYDVNVIIKALNNKDLEAVWFDKRKKLNDLRLENVFGFLLNVPVQRAIPVPVLANKHWLAVRKVDGAFYNLDSKLQEPLKIGEEDESVLEFLGEKLKGDVQLFVVVNAKVAEEKSWIGT